MKRARWLPILTLVPLAALAWLGWWQYERSAAEAALDRGIALAAAGDCVAARPLLERALRRNPRVREGHAALALYVCNVVEGLPARMPPSSRTSPRDRRMALGVARRMLDAHRYSAAEPLLLLALGGRDRDEVEARQSLALLYKIEGRLAEARSVFCEAIELMPDPVAVLREVYDIQFGPYPIDPIRRTIEQAALAAPGDPGVQMARAHLLLQEGDFAGARQALEPALSQKDRLPRGLNALRTLERAIAMQAGDRAALARSLSQTPRDWINPRDFGKVWSWVAQLSQDAQAERDALEYRISVPPVDFEALAARSELAMRLADKEQAVAWSQSKASHQQALEDYRDVLFFDIDPLLRADLQESLAEQLGLFPEQRAWIHLALRRNPADPALRTAIQHWQPLPPVELPSQAPHVEDLIRVLAPSGTTAAHRVEPASDHGQSRVAFEDRAPAASLVFEYNPGRRRRRELPETMGGGLAAFDYDRDGWVDLFAVQGGQFPPAAAEKCADKLFHNRGDGTFEDVSAKAGFPAFAGGYGMGVTVGDIDNDGYSDLFVTRWRGYALYRNRGDGAFEDITARLGLAGDRDWPASAAFADIDNDGDLDLYVCHYVVWDPLNPQGTRANRSADTLRYNNPLNYTALPDHLFRNDGDRFTEISETAGIRAADADGRGLGVVAAHLNADNRIDFYVANDLTANFLFFNRDGGIFDESGEESGVAGSGDGLYQGSMGVACADIDRDGLFDLAATNFYGDSMAVYKALGHGLFADHTGPLGLKAPTRFMVGWGLAFEDFDNDGLLDLVMANGHLDEHQGGLPYAMPTQLFLARRNAPFQDWTRIAGPSMAKPRVARALAAADFDNDGRVDVAVNAHDGPVALLRNQSENVGHYLRLTLEGKASNRDAIGARVTVQAGAETWYGQRTGGGSYQSAGDARLHFGLGRNSRVDRVVVSWPSGHIDTFESLASDQGYLLVEGEPVPRPEPRQGQNGASGRPPQD